MTYVTAERLDRNGDIMYNALIVNKQEQAMCKHFVLMRDVITKYHPEFVKNAQLTDYAMRNPTIFNVERLVEECLAHVGGYKFIDAAHADFSDGTDSKTASIRVNPMKPGTNSHAGEIAGVETAGGGQKRGGLRCTIYNPHTDSLMFYFLPKWFWEDHITIHPTSLVGKIVYTYHRVHNYIAKFDGFQVNTFEDLARS